MLYLESSQTAHSGCPRSATSVAAQGRGSGIWNVFASTTVIPARQPIRNRSIAMIPQTCPGPSCDQTGRTWPTGTPSQTASGGSIVKATKTRPNSSATAPSTSGYSAEMGLRQ